MTNSVSRRALSIAKIVDRLPAGTTVLILDKSDVRWEVMTYTPNINQLDVNHVEQKEYTFKYKDLTEKP